MYLCDRLDAEAWRPDFSSSGQASPTWTRVRCEGMEITNALEWLDWTSNPVQAVLCDACGHESCASGGFVHVSRWDQYVLWSMAQSDDTGLPDDDFQPPRVIRTLGALAIPVATWNGWAGAIPEVPRADRLDRANYAAIADAWILGPARSRDSIATHLRDRLVGGDTLDKNEAIALVERVMTTFRANALAPFEQRLLSVTEMNARIETLHFDGSSELDWPAFAFSGDEMFVALDQERLVRFQA